MLSGPDSPSTTAPEALLCNNAVDSKNFCRRFASLRHFGWCDGTRTTGGRDVWKCENVYIHSATEGMFWKSNGRTSVAHPLKTVINLLLQLRLWILYIYVWINVFENTRSSWPSFLFHVCLVFLFASATQEFKIKFSGAKQSMPKRARSLIIRYTNICDNTHIRARAPARAR